MKNCGSNRRRKVANCSALRSGCRGQRLGDIHALQRGPAEGEDDAKDKDKGDCRVGGGCLGSIVCGHLARAGDDGEADGGKDSGVEQQGPAAYHVGHSGPENRAEKRERGINSVKGENLVLVGDARGFEHVDHVVARQAVPADLAKHRHADDTDKATAGRVGIPKLVVVVPLLVGRLGRNLAYHFPHLELDHRVADSALAVVGCEHLGGLVVPVLRHEPSRTFRQPEDTQTDDARRDHLAPNWDAPCIKAVDVSAAVDDPRGDDAPDVPCAVIQSGNGAPPFGMGHLRDVARG